MRRNGPQKMDLKGSAATATDAIAVDAWVEHLVLANTGGTARTVTILDKASSPNTVLSLSAPANATTAFEFPGGLYFEAGININMSHADMRYSIGGTSVKV